MSSYALYMHEKHPDELHMVNWSAGYNELLKFFAKGPKALEGHDWLQSACPPRLPELVASLGNQLNFGDAVPTIFDNPAFQSIKGLCSKGNFLKW